ncbi:MAG: hypothetical protein BGN85_05730 [Alphaproteobacteria bacterium 64-11]|mgnify:CR=1 FL=1|nr:hypothetical protein [Alphaproteobacteria bacterium]OJU13850.1 MAG: hypothetical protein BGN85_05730 [Alphaproteobacteria bacterium 64-11]
MAMPSPSGPPPQYQVLIPRRSNGCLWGCVAVFLVMTLPLVLAGGYWAWFFYQGYRHDPAVRLARELVERDGLARQVLGTPITISGVEGNAWSWMPGVGQTNSAILSLYGPRGDGTLEIHSHAGPGGPQLDEATLTGPDGARYDLLHHRALPGGGDLGDTI